MAQDSFGRHHVCGEHNGLHYRINGIIPPEKANNYDVGVQQRVTPALTIGLDTYYKQSVDLVDEGQVGVPIVLTPFNCWFGKQYGAELARNYTAQDFGAYLNLAAQSASGGASYLWRNKRFSADFVLGSRLRASERLPPGETTTYGGTSIPDGTHLPNCTQVNAGMRHVLNISGAGTLTARFGVTNVLDRIYEIRNGTGVGAGAPQYGPRRGFFVGLSKSL